MYSIYNQQRYFCKTNRLVKGPSLCTANQTALTQRSDKTVGLRVKEGQKFNQQTRCVGLRVREGQSVTNRQVDLRVKE